MNSLYKLKRFDSAVIVLPLLLAFTGATSNASEPKSLDLVVPKSVSLAENTITIRDENFTPLLYREGSLSEPHVVQLHSVYPSRWDSIGERVVVLTAMGLHARRDSQVAFTLHHFESDVVDALFGDPAHSQERSLETNDLDQVRSQIEKGVIHLDFLWEIYFINLSHSEGFFFANLPLDTDYSELSPNTVYEKGNFHYDIVLRESGDLLLVCIVDDRLSIWQNPLDSAAKPIGRIYKDTAWNHVLTTTWITGRGFQIISASDALMVLIDNKSRLLEVSLPSSLSNDDKSLGDATTNSQTDPLDTLLGPPDPAFAPRVIEENVVVKGIVKDSESGEVRLLAPDGDTGELKMRSVRKSAAETVSSDIEERLDKAKNFLIEIQSTD